MDILSIMRSYHSQQGTADIGEPDDVSDAVGARGGLEEGAGGEYSVNGGSANGISVQIVMGGGGFLAVVCVFW